VAVGPFNLKPLALNLRTLLSGQLSSFDRRTFDGHKNCAAPEIRPNHHPRNNESASHDASHRQRACVTKRLVGSAYARANRRKSIFTTPTARLIWGDLQIARHPRVSQKSSHKSCFKRHVTRFFYPRVNMTRNTRGFKQGNCLQV
jgi:hypothetical protein